MPTSGGKTIVAAAIIHSARRNFDAKVLFVAHRLELIDQAVAQLARWGITEIGVIRADDEREAPLMPIQVASVQTLARRNVALKPSVVITDECHRAVADTYQKNIFDAYPDAVHIGLTATPCRADGRPLGRSSGGPFDALEVAATYTDLIRDKFVAEPCCFSAPPMQLPDLSSVKINAGDYDLGELEEVMRGEALIAGIYERWIELHGDRKTVIFATGIDHSRMIVERFRERGVQAAHIDGKTPEHERRAVLSDLEKGQLEVVSNVGVLEEGWDCPPVKCASIARPTKSLRLYMQQVGRILRPWNDYVPIILDHAGNFDRHGAPHEDRIWSIEGPPRKKSEANFKLCPKCYAYLRSNLRECPHCGHSFASAPRERKPIHEVNVPLVERQKKIDEQARRYSEFRKIVELARHKGFRAGFASAKYKEKYGAWPPWEWSQEAKASFDRDGAWQRRLAVRDEYRKQRAEEGDVEGRLDKLAEETFREWDQ
jgi:superfamily II DNA or RNA helicase